jgi:hypothetical protein
MAGLSVNIRSDVWKLKDQLDDLAKTQIPFATARALTTLATLAKAEVITALPQRFDRPTPFTMRGPAITVATKASQRATVYIKPIQAAYLALQETGGERTPPKTALVVPVQITLNAYGNIPKGQLARLKGKGNVFVANVNGIGGFWQRLPGDKLKLLVRFTPEAQYKPRFGYHLLVANVVTRNRTAVLRAALANALKSARR